MAKRKFNVILTRTHRTDKPIVEMNGFPGLQAELTPLQLRAMAKTLLQIADDAEASYHYITRREYVCD